MSWLMLEYLCRKCGEVSESLQTRSAPVKTLSHPPCGCAARADRVTSAPKVKTCWASAVTTGKSDCPPDPRACDTRELADGMPLGEWKAKRAKQRRDERRAWVKQQIS